MILDGSLKTLNRNEGDGWERGSVGRALAQRVRDSGVSLQHPISQYCGLCLRSGSGGAGRKIGSSGHPQLQRVFEAIVGYKRQQMVTGGDDLRMGVLL